MGPPSHEDPYQLFSSTLFNLFSDKWNYSVISKLALGSSVLQGILFFLIYFP